MKILDASENHNNIANSLCRARHAVAAFDRSLNRVDEEGNKDPFYTHKKLSNFASAINAALKMDKAMYELQDIEITDPPKYVINPVDVKEGESAVVCLCEGITFGVRESLETRCSKVKAIITDLVTKLKEMSSKKNEMKYSVFLDGSTMNKFKAGKKYKGLRTSVKTKLAAIEQDFDEFYELVCG